MAIAKDNTYSHAFGEGSSELANATLVHCYSFVGIIEELAASLHVLVQAVPLLLSGLNVSHALQLSPKNPSHGRSANVSMLAWSTELLRRSDYLRPDFLVYTQARSRLLSLAASAPLV